jgi:hypothetical protein
MGLRADGDNGKDGDGWGKMVELRDITDRWSYRKQRESFQKLMYIDPRGYPGFSS